MRKYGFAMIFHITRYELLRHFREGQSRMLIITTSLLMVAAMTLSIREFTLANNHYQENLLQSRINWESQTAKDPHDAAHDGTYVIKPLYPAMVLDKGIYPYTGQVIHLGAHERKQSSLNQAKDHVGLFRFGELTPSFVLLYLFPILLIFLGYNTFSEEKEKGNLRLLLAQGATTFQVVFGKWLALVMLMLIFSLVVVLIGGVSLGIMGEQVEISGYEWLAIIICYLIYFFAFINLIIIVSSRSKSSGVSLVTLLACWIFMTLIVPKLSTLMAGRLYPFPTLQRFKDNIYQDQKDGLNGHNFWNEAAQVFKQKVLLEYGVNSIEELPVDYGGLLLAEGEKYESEVYSKHFDLLQNQYHKQRHIFRLSSLCSPSLSVRYISMALARTDYHFQWDFEEQAEQYRVVLNTALNMNIAENAKGVEGYKAHTDLWAQTPQFHYQWEKPGQIIQDHLYEYTNICGWGIFSFIVMLAVSRNIKVG